MKYVLSVVAVLGVVSMVWAVLLKFLKSQKNGQWIPLDR